jgi:hypothetical protein
VECEKTFSKKQIGERVSAFFHSPTFRWGCVLFGLALIPRWLWAIVEHPHHFSDMEDYYLCAVNLLKGDYLAQSPDRLAYRAPLYPLFLAFGLRILPATPF